MPRSGSRPPRRDRWAEGSILPRGDGEGRLCGGGGGVGGMHFSQKEVKEFVGLSSGIVKDGVVERLYEDDLKYVYTSSFMHSH